MVEYSKITLPDKIGRNLGKNESNKKQAQFDCRICFDTVLKNTGKYFTG
jgi:hypothetical protein